MDFAYSARINGLLKNVNDFMDRYIYPNEQTYRAQIAASGNPHHHAEIVDELKAKARAAGLWNLFLPDKEYGAGLTNLEYAPWRRSWEGLTGPRRYLTARPPIQAI